jgi:hypothetical protein
MAANGRLICPVEGLLRAGFCRSGSHIAAIQIVLPGAGCNEGGNTAA